MSNCLNCGKEVPQTEGKRARKYCDNKGACKQQYWVKTHPKEDKFKKIPIEQHDKMIIVVEDKDGKWVMDGKRVNFMWADKSKGEEINFSKQGVISISEEQRNSIPEYKEPKEENTNPDLLTQYEQELSTLGDGQFAKARKKWLQNKIKELTKTQQ